MIKHVICALSGMQVQFLAEGKTDQFYDVHFQLAAFGAHSDSHPYQVSVAC